MTSVVLSSVAIALSVATFYWTVLRPASLVAAAPRMLGLAQLGDGTAGLGVTLFLANEGAKPAHVDFLFARIENSVGEASSMYCHYEGNFLKLIEELPRPTQELTPQPFTLAANASVTKRLVFISRNPLSLIPGDVEIAIYVVLARSDKPYLVGQQRLQLNAPVPKGKSFEAIVMDRFKKLPLDPRQQPRF